MPLRLAAFYGSEQGVGRLHLDKLRFSLRLFTVVLIRFTCPAMTVRTVMLKALDRVRKRALGLLGARSPKSPPARRNVVSST